MGLFSKYDKVGPGVSKNPDEKLPVFRFFGIFFSHFGASQLHVLGCTSSVCTGHACGIRCRGSHYLYGGVLRRVHTFGRCVRTGNLRIYKDSQKRVLRKTDVFVA